MELWYIVEAFRPGPRSPYPVGLTCMAVGDPSQVPTISARYMPWSKLPWSDRALLDQSIFQALTATRIRQASEPVSILDANGKSETIPFYDFRAWKARANKSRGFWGAFTFYDPERVVLKEGGPAFDFQAVLDQFYLELVCR